MLEPRSSTTFPASGTQRWSSSPHPWNAACPPIELRVPARKVTGWKLQHLKKLKVEGRLQSGNFDLTPAIPDDEWLAKHLGKSVETIRLVPYGCTHLRMTILPQCGI